MRIESLRVNHLAKRTHAQFLRDVNFSLYQGSFHAILIQNSQSMACLIQALSGEDPPDAGDIYLYDKKVKFFSVGEMKRRGIFVIPRKNNLIANLSIGENLFLNDDRYYRAGFANTRLMHRLAEELLEESGLQNIKPWQSAGRLSAAQAHMVAVIRAVSMGAQTLILENITEQYTLRECQKLISLIRILKESGISFLFLSPKYSYLFEHAADYASIIHKGSSVITLSKDKISKAQILQHFHIKDNVGVSGQSKNTAHAVLRLPGFITDFSGQPLDLEIGAGEVVGICDENWSFCPLMLDTLFHRDRRSEAPIFLNGCSIGKRDPRSLYRKGLVLINENHSGDQIFYNMSLSQNVTVLMRSPLYNGLRLHKSSVEQYICRHVLELLHCGYMLERYGALKYLPPLPRKEQFKIALAKWMCLHPKVIVLVNPFLHFDDLTMQELLDLTRVLRGEHIALLIMSTNIKEIKLLSDRVLIADANYRTINAVNSE